MTPRTSVRILGLLLAAAVTAIVAAPAAGHGLEEHASVDNIPQQHRSQLLPANPLGKLPASTEVLPGAKCENGSAGPYPCQNVDMASSVPLPFLGLGNGNDVWGWTDPDSGREFAIMGTSTATAFVEVTDPANPKVTGHLPQEGGSWRVLWRDVKVDGHYAFIVAEQDNSGLQVFDLNRLLDAEEHTVFDSDAHYTEFSRAHNISINEDSDTAYVVGSNDCTNGDEAGGLHMVDISDPLEPTFAGCAVVGDNDGDRSTESDNYAHDVECVNYDGPDADYAGREICFGSNENAVVIYDVTDKKNPEVISVRGYDTAAYTHQGSLTEDRRWFLFGDELDESRSKVENTTTYILDVSDLDSPPEPAVFAHQTESIDHNMYVHGSRVYQSNYAAGLRILEFDDASLGAGQLNEVAYFDVVPHLDPTEYAGTWSNYRFPNSGTTVVSTIENMVSGLFVLTPQLGDEGGGDTDGPGKGKGKGKGGGRPDDAGPPDHARGPHKH